MSRKIIRSTFLCPDHKIANSVGKEIFTNVTLHPGEVIDMGLEARGIKKSVFAAQIGLKASRFSALLHGKRHVSAAIALKLEEQLNRRVLDAGTGLL